MSDTLPSWRRHKVVKWSLFSKKTVKKESRQTLILSRFALIFVAERERFELSDGFTHHTISKSVPYLSGSVNWFLIDSTNA
jgi:hypothetical protein